MGECAQVQSEGQEKSGDGGRAFSEVIAPSYLAVLI